MLSLAWKDWERKASHFPPEVAFQLYSFHWGGIVGLWGKAQKNAQNSLHSITIGSSTLGKRAIFKLLNDGALARS